MTIQVLEFSGDLFLKIPLETYYEQDVVPEAIMVQKWVRDNLHPHGRWGYKGCCDSGLRKVRADSRAT